MTNMEKLVLKLKQLKLQKRELVLANKDTEKIDREIKDVEIKIEALLVNKESN